MCKVLRQKFVKTWKIFCIFDDFFIDRNQISIMLRINTPISNLQERYAKKKDLISYIHVELSRKNSMQKRSGRVEDS